MWFWRTVKSKRIRDHPRIIGISAVLDCNHVLAHCELAGIYCETAAAERAASQNCCAFFEGDHACGRCSGRTDVGCERKMLKAWLAADNLNSNGRIGHLQNVVLERD